MINRGVMWFAVHHTLEGEKSHIDFGLGRLREPSITCIMQFELKTGSARPGPAMTETRLCLGAVELPLRFVHHPRAKRYILRLDAEGKARVTVPRYGSLSAARAFALRNSAWLERQWMRRAAGLSAPPMWKLGTEVLLRGERVCLESDPAGRRDWIRLGSEALRVDPCCPDLRTQVERRLREVAAVELAERARELSVRHAVPFRRVSVRDQRSRWGSMSRRGTLSLNWRLLQAPAFVRDYLILHELAHVKEMNHSPRFWREVARICPDFKSAEAWLRAHARCLR
jgi:predicted metal-dependent hydrolase